MLIKVLNATMEHPTAVNVTWDAKLGVHAVSTSHVTQLLLFLGQTGFIREDPLNLRPSYLFSCKRAARMSVVFVLV